MGQKFIITESDRKYIRGLYSHLIKEDDNSIKCQEWINQNFLNSIPYDEFYVGGRCKDILQEYVINKVNSIDPVKHAESFLPEAKKFYIEYFDYNKTPEILDKILTISKNNGKPTTKENVIKVIDSMKNELFNSVSFEMDFEFNRDNPETMMYTLNNNNEYKIYICGMNDKLFVGNYEFGSDKEWFNSVRHELGHLIDFWFLSNKIILHKNIKSSGTLIPYPHQGVYDDDFLYWGEYQRDTDEQFVRFKTLFDIMKQHGLTITATLDTFVNVFKKIVNDKTISFEGCSYTIENNLLKIDENCDSLKDRTLHISLNGDEDHDLTYLFSNYTIVDEIYTESGDETGKFNYQINLGTMYNDWKNEYVMNQDNKQTVTSVPNYPTA
jgi:hypothetical protein